MHTDLVPSPTPHNASGTSQNEVREASQTALTDPVGDANRAIPYVARILQQHLVDSPASRWWTADGTAVFVDISGFTKLSERLARKGREGAEQITEAIGTSFEGILAVAYENGGSLLKFGGDALLLWFESEGHATRACRATILMRRVLREVGRIEVPGAKVTLRMTQGVHSGRFHFFAVGTSHFEFLPVGPAWTRLVELEHWAVAGEIMVSPETAEILPSSCVSELEGRGMLLRREPAGHREKLPLVPRPKMPAETLARCLSSAISAHVLAGGGTSEHRPVTIAFIHFDGTDALIERSGVDATAEALHRLVSAVEVATEERGVAFLGSDVDADGGKLILTAGAPKVIGDDEERMLLALRKIRDTNLELPIRIGVHRGSVFAGDIGPFYRRTYTVMGDAVNLSARLMAKADPGSIYATAEVLDRSNTIFENVELVPFAVKGKAEPVKAWAVGHAIGSRTRNVSLERLPLIGRDKELALIREALASARSGHGRLIEIVGELGAGKTRLLQALREDAVDLRSLHAACEAYSASTPYATWGELLREYMEIGRDEPDAVVAERITAEVNSRSPDLAPWLPLIGIVFGVALTPTPEVEMLAENNRRPKLHEVLGRFLEVAIPEPVLIEIENAQHMDVASAELLSFLTRSKCGTRPWLFGIARRPSDAGFTAPQVSTVVKIELEPLTPEEALRFAKLATTKHPLPMHVLDVVAKRSGGNPQFLRDLLHSAVQSGGVDGLPDSAESAAMARIDALSPEDRALVRRASVLGLTFHPRMLSWLASDGDEARSNATTWTRLHQLFDVQPDGYVRFRRSLLRDAAYEGLPYKLRRRLHGAFATKLEGEVDNPEESSDILSLHYFLAGDNRSAWRYGTIAANRAAAVYAYVEAARLYTRAIEAGRRVEEVGAGDLVAVQRALGNAWYQTAEFSKAADAYTGARKLVARDALTNAGLLLELSHVEAKLGQYKRARRWAAKVRTALKGNDTREAARQTARSDAWYAMMLQWEGRWAGALAWSKRAIAEADAADEKDALGDAYSVMAWAHNALGKKSAIELMQQSLKAYQQSGNLVMQAGVLGNIGVLCALEGRWDDAMSYLGQAHEGALKIGDSVGVAQTRDNIAEILTDRGEWAEAQPLLLESLPLWRTSQHRYYLACCLMVLGRVSLSLGSVDQALGYFEEAKANYLFTGADDEAPLAEARIAECYVAQGNAEAALERIGAMLGPTSTSGGVSRALPLIERVRAHALAVRGDRPGARRALEASLAAARDRRQPLDVALALLSLIELDRLEGNEPLIESVTESRTILADLKIRATPHVPHAAA